mmetsp:Transcript_15107/g.33044  ORF Transcript_15107/g.33044 Transcript_15107/m.33044 type:complete len:590 (+) Transcript_15107:163-1932(+)
MAMKSPSIRRKTTAPQRRRSTFIALAMISVAVTVSTRQVRAWIHRPVAASTTFAIACQRKVFDSRRIATQTEPSVRPTVRQSILPTTRLFTSNVDEFGRRSRAGRQLEPNDNSNSNKYDDDDDWNIVPFEDNDDFPPHHRQNSNRNNGPRSRSGDYDNEDDSGGWDDFDPFTSKQRRSSPTPSSRGPPSRSSRGPPPNRSRSNNNGHRRDGNYNNRSNRRNNNSKTDNDRKVNMKALEGAGFVHLYGLSSCLNALHANVRDFSRPEDSIDIDLLDDESRQHEELQRQRKPEAQFSPWLFVQDSKVGSSGRSGSKARQAQTVLELAEKRGIPIAHVDKGTLNTLSGNRPHQGYVLRCGKLQFDSVARLPLPGPTTVNEDDDDDTTAAVTKTPDLWLALDEVVDPQNLGALLRSAYFLGSNSNQKKVGVLVCAKNSAPPSPVVSASSAGALEFMAQQGILVSTNNLPRTLASAEQEGFRIVGASSSIPRELLQQYDNDADADDEDSGIRLYELEDLPPIDGPTILVLGSEGHGLRSLVARSCTEFVRISGGGESAAEEGQDATDDSPAGVDSLNVSVTGGILLWQLLRGSA